MIRRYDFGTPIPTDAVVVSVPMGEGNLPHMTTSRCGEALSFTVHLGEDDMIFGLGENVRGINKRGFRYRAWNTDDPNHHEGRECLYSSHNLLIFTGACGLFGVYFDDPGNVVFDLGYTDSDQAVITSSEGNVSVYLIEEDSLKGIVHAFRSIIGQSYLPPKWAFGYIQSRWGYATEDEIRTIVREHRTRHIPLDGVSMDIDYMERFKDFTWNQSHFSDLSKLTGEMREEHIRLVPIIDAGVKQEKGYDVCDEGLEKGYFCLKADGKPFVGAVWPGHSYFPDFLRPEVRAWFGRQYFKLLDAGIEGFWNDMNEPALFYSEETLQEAIELAESCKGKNLGVEECFHLKGVFQQTANNMEDYRRFYHVVDGKPIRHDRVHNLYGYNMTRAAAEGFEAYQADKRYLLFSRSSYVGAHRYGGVWQGDNCSWWSHILLNLKQLPSLNMCGFLFNGADLGGFGQNTTEDLLLRWLQLGVFTPLMRNHSAQHTRDQEIYRFRRMDDMRRVLTVRYALLPYLYSEFMKAAFNNEMLFRPLAFDYPEDDAACRTEDQVMLGGECMIAPVYEQNARGRHVYLPEDMLMVRFRSAEDYDLLPMTAGHHWVTLNLNEFPLFIRRGAMIPLSHGGEWVEAVDSRTLTLLGWDCDHAKYVFYDDDGQSKDAKLEGHLYTLRADAPVEGFCLDGSKLIGG